MVYSYMWNEDANNDYGIEFQIGFGVCTFDTRTLNTNEGSY